MSPPDARNALKALYGLEQCAMTAMLLVSLDAWLPPPPAAWLLWSLACLPLTWAWARLCLGRRWHPAWELAGGLALGAASVWALWRVSLPANPPPPEDLLWVRQGMILAAGVFCWASGWRLARVRLTRYRVIDLVHWTLAMLMVLLLPASLHGASVHLPLGWLAVFTLAALCSLWLVRRLEGPPGGNLGRGALAFGVALVSFAALTAALWLGVSRRLLAMFAEPAGAAAEGLAGLGAYLEGTVLWLVGLLRGGMLRGAAQAPPPPPAGGGGSAAGGLLAQGGSGMLGKALLLGLMALLACFLLFMAYWTIREILARMAASAQGAPPAVGFWRALCLAWRRCLEALAQAGRRLRALWPGGGRDRGQGAAVHLYQNLERWGQARGLPRRPGQTPLEHLDRLGAAYPELAGEMGLIVGQFVARRYGPDTQTDRDAQERARRAWRRVSAVRLRLGKRKPLTEPKDDEA